VGNYSQYEHNRRDDQNISASIREAIAKRQVFSKRIFRIQFCVNSSIGMALATSKPVVIVIPAPYPPLIKGPDCLTFLLKPALSCIPSRNPTRSRFLKHKEHGSFPCHRLALASVSLAQKLYPQPHRTDLAPKTLSNT
jgi:hypothetical protein